MSTETLALAAEAVGDKHWRWLPGMLDTDGHRVVLRWSAKAGHVLRRCHDVGLHEEDIEGDWLPDLDDAATLGCLLALVREAWGVPSLQCGHVGGWDDDWDTWQVSNPPGRGHGCCFKGTGPTEAAALVAALRGAP